MKVWKKVLISLFFFFFGTIIIASFLSIFFKPTTSPDGTNYITSPVYVLIILLYWTISSLLIWDDKKRDAVMKKIRGMPVQRKNVVSEEQTKDKTDDIQNEVINIEIPDGMDPLYEEAKKFVIESQSASTSLIQRKFGTGYVRSARLIEILEMEGVIGPQQGSKPRVVLMDKYIPNEPLWFPNFYTKNDEETEEIENITKYHMKFAEDYFIATEDKEFYSILEKILEKKYFNVQEIINEFNLSFGIMSKYIESFKNLEIIDQQVDYDNSNDLLVADNYTITDFKFTVTEALNSFPIIVSLAKLNQIKDGFEFERFIASALEKNGYYDVEVTQASNDYGIDVIAYKDQVKYAIQCKHYSSPVSNSSVQEVAAGMKFYNAHVGVVATNSTFTKNAEELARANNILLWDRETIMNLIK
jgi:Predicted endonuclease distantly related to archaeal Holliday junction resolvase and Mrr-like restriction enzymes